MLRALLFYNALLLLVVPVQAQGLIIDREARPIPLELRQHQVDAAVHERLAVVTVTHAFVNTGHATVEGSFLFPLPPDAQVSRFSMTVDGKEMSGELLSSEEARKIYEDIVRRSLDPALLEMADYRTFRVRIFPIPPGATRTITLRYDATLPADGQTVTFRYPMQGSLAYRPTGGVRPLPQPRERHGASSLEQDTPRQSLIRVDLATATGVKNIYSPSHPIDVRRKGNREAQAVYEASEVLDGRDFVLYYSLDPSDIGATLLAHRPYTDRPGYFMLLLDPPVDLDEQDIPPQDVVFVLDTSGSMRGDKMKQARDALRYCLAHLGPRDSFGLVAFSTDVDAFREDLRPASARDDARYFVDQLEARGGTNIHDALLVATAMLKDSDNALIVFMTDGLPSVGTTDEVAIRASIQKAGGAGVRLFSFGVGYDVNTRLLDGLSGTSGAFADYISPEENIETRVAAFFDKVRFPVLTDLDLDMDGRDAYALAPGTLPNLYKGNQLIVAGRYRKPGAVTVTLQGRLEGTATTKRYTFRLPEAERDRDFVARLWATRRVGQLLEEIRLKGENKELKEEVIALAKEFGLVTPYTSYLVQEDEAMAGQPINVRRDGRAFAPPPSEEALQMNTGRAAVEASKQIRAMQEADAVQDSPASWAVVQGRTLRQDAAQTWVDLAFEESKANPVQIKFASDAYFAFLRLYPEAREFAQLGQAVTFFFQGQYVQIGTEEKPGLDETVLRALFN